MKSLEFSRRAKRRGVTLHRGEQPDQRHDSLGVARPRRREDEQPAPRPRLGQLDDAQLGLGLALGGADRHHGDAGAGLHHRRHRVEAAHAHTVVRHAPGTTPRLLKAAFVGLWLGVKVRARIGAGTFQRALFVVFIGLGVANLVA